MSGPNPLTPSQEAREAAASGYFAWISSNTVIPAKMREGTADDHSIVQSFARFEQAIRKDEAEKCARVADDMNAVLPLEEKDWFIAESIATALRARHAEGEG